MNAIVRPAFNPVFWLMWLLPGLAALAGFTTLAIALEEADRALPADYHWEGDRLDEDFARASAAAALRIEAVLTVEAGQCRALLRNLPDVAALNVLFTHGSDPGLDRRLRLQRVSEGDYRVACAPLEPGRWRVAMDDDSGKWAIRGDADDLADGLYLRARTPDGGNP